MEDRQGTPETITMAPLQDHHPLDSNLTTQVADAERYSVDGAIVHVLLLGRTHRTVIFFALYSL